MTHRWARAPTLGAVHLLCGSLIILCLTNTCRCDVPVCKTRTNLLLPPPSLQPHAIAVSSKRSRLELNVSKFFPSPIHLSVERCLVPHAIIPSPVPSTVLGTPNAQNIYSHFVVRVGVVSSHLARSQVHVDVILKLRSPNSFQSTLYSTKLCIPYYMEVAIGNHCDTFLFPLTPDWVIDDTEIMVHKLSPRTTYSFYAALHQVPAITDAERNRSPNLLDRYFLALGPLGPSEDPKPALQDLLDLNTMHFSSVELITDAAGKRHFQFGTLGDDITTQMTFIRQHFPSTLSPTFTFALDVQLVIPQGSVKSFGCDICAMLSHQLHSHSNVPEEHCLYITALHIEQHRLKHQPDADENHLYPVLITAPWTDRMMKLRDINITFKCRVSIALSSFRIRPIGAYLINDSYPSPHASLMTTHSASAPPISSKSLEPPIAELTSTTLDNTVIKSPLHVIVTPASVDPPLSALGTQEHALGAPSFPEPTHAEVSPSGGETVPTPDPHDTRDPTVSPVQPRSRRMGSLRAVVGALGAGRRSTSVVAAAVVRHGMPRTGRAGAWGTGRAALLVLGVVCGVGLLLAAVVCSLTWRYRIVGSKWNFHQFQSWVVEPAATSCPPKKCVTSSMGVGALSSV